MRTNNCNASDDLFRSVVDWSCYPSYSFAHFFDINSKPIDLYFFYFVLKVQNVLDGMLRQFWESDFAYHSLKFCLLDMSEVDFSWRGRMEIWHYTAWI